MNFKPSKLKVLFSVIAFFIVDTFLSSRVITKLNCSPNTDSICGYYPVFYAHMADPVPLAAGLAGAIIVYLVWSLAEKKKSSKN
ncbi:MAG: hypothetical protein Q7R70_04370 [Candidatus Diapherotrites archaeon]|nr:hypothetical protein [Candidatus Diapherotrites archaeon]